MRRVGAAATTLAVLALGTAASPASASVTIGQTLPTSGTCTTGYDWVQPTVTSGNSFVVPQTVAVGAITSWSTNTNEFDGELTMKVYRPVAGFNYMVVGHDGPRTVTANTVNTFGGISVPVKAGDVLGLHAGAGDPGCVSDVTADAGYFLLADLADGQSGDFAPDSDDRLSISAVVNPSNAFTLGRTVRNKKRGTATVTANVPNPGELTAGGKGVKVAGDATTSKAVGAGQAQLLIKAKGKKRRLLNETGKVSLTPKLKYTPTGGDPRTQSIKLKLKKKL
jgi:hypothetical protein